MSDETNIEAEAKAHIVVIKETAYLCSPSVVTHVYELRERIKELEEILKEQRESIVALNTALGGEGSLTTDNLVKVGRLEHRIKELETIALGWNATHIDRIKELEAEFTESNKDNIRLCEEMEGMQSRIKELEAENEALQSAFVDGYDQAKNELRTQYAECRKAALLEAAELIERSELYNHIENGARLRQMAGEER